MKYRKYPIILLDLLSIGWLIYVLFFERSSNDFFGLFFFVFVGLLILYNLYAILLAKFFYKNDTPRFHIEVAYLVLLILPILVLWHFTR